MTTGAMHCTYCGRPAESVVWVNGYGYHQECLRGPVYEPPVYGGGWQSPAQPLWFGLTEQRVREIVREELAKEKP